MPLCFVISFHKYSDGSTGMFFSSPPMFDGVWPEAVIDAILLLLPSSVVELSRPVVETLFLRYQTPMPTTTGAPITNAICHFDHPDPPLSGTAITTNHALLIDEMCCHLENRLR